MALPLACVLNHKVIVLHGGVGFPSNSNVTLSDLENIERKMDIPLEGLLCDVLWSDPTDSTIGVEYNHMRGCSHLFGPDVTKKFLQDNGLELLIRSHQVQMDGYSVEANGKLITVFSAPQYAGYYDNDGAFIRLNGSDMKPQFTTFKGSPY